MTAKLPPEVEEAIQQAMTVPGYCNCGPTRVEFANHGCDDLKAAITAACEKAYAAGRTAQHRADVDHRPFEEWGKYHGCGVCAEFERDSLRAAAEAQQ